MTLLDRIPAHTGKSSPLKLSKLLYRAFNAFRFKYEARKILRTIDLDRFEEFKKKYCTASPDPGYSKYLDIKTWIEINVRNYFALDLYGSGSLNILDIGTGCGYFPYICNYYGHHTITCDVDEEPMYREITAFLKIDRRLCRVNAYEKLPNFGKRFNLVTAFLVCFNNHGSTHVWGIAEWSFFLKDVATNQLDANGRLFLLLNDEPISGNHGDKLRSFFLDKGANVSGNRIYFDTMKAFLKQPRQSVERRIT